MVKKQAIGRPVSSRRDGHGRIPLMPRLVPNDVTIWLQDRQGRFEKSPRVVQVDVRGSRPFVGVAPNPTIYRGEHGRVVRVVVHRCGLLGCRVGEASNPGPVQTRQARRLEIKSNWIQKSEKHTNQSVFR